MPKALATLFTRRPLYATSYVVLILSAIFLAMPQIDLWVSGWFHDGANGFWLKYEALPRLLRRIGILIPRLMVAAMLGFLIARLFWPQIKCYAPLSKILFLGLTAILGPGLLVNLILKAHWGRARPIQTDLFGGDWPFSEVWVIANNCQSNCSFVSGEGAMSFWMVATLILLPLALRKKALIGLGIFALLISFNRIAFGGHYLSDILLSWALTAWIMIAVWQLTKMLTDLASFAQKLEQKWDHAGNNLRPWLKSKTKKSRQTASNLLNKQNSDRKNDP